MLYQVNYQELKSLVLQYPYAPNLRTLLVLKNLLDNHKDFEHNLTLASVYSINRRKLRDLIKLHNRLRCEQENYALGEDFLELKDLSAIEDEMSNPAVAEVPMAQEQVPTEGNLSKIQNLSTDDFQVESVSDEKQDFDFLENLPSGFVIPEDRDTFSDTVLLDEVEGSENSPDEVEEPEASEPATLIENLSEEGEPGPQDVALDILSPLWDSVVDAAAILAVIEDLAAIAGEISGDNVERSLQSPVTIQKKSVPLEITNDEEALQPIPKSSFNSWLLQFRPPEVQSLSIRIQEHSGKDEREEVGEEQSPPVIDEARAVAARSIAEDFGVASETLAALLEAQGLYDKAISMYERLCLQYPEKSIFFAAKITELKNK